MRWLEKIEKRFDWLAFPGLYKYLAFLGLLAFVSHWAQPDLGMLLDFDKEAILHGQVWRLFTFVFATEAYANFSSWNMVMIVFGTMLSVTISDSMDDYWGSTRVTLFLLVSWLCGLALAWLSGIGGMGALVLAPLFFAFATYFPKFELQILLIFPVQIRFIAIFAALSMIATVFKFPALLIVYVPAMLPYFIWVVPDFFNGAVRLAGSAARRAKFNNKQLSTGDAFHRCENCGRTEKTNPTLDFFTAADGHEYCADHVPAKETSQL